MAKYDTYTFSLTLGDEKNRANLSLTVLFEDGDNVDDVIKDVKAKIKTEAIEMKSQDYLKDVEQ